MVIPLNILGWTPGTFEIVAILIVAVLVFGRRLPDIARGMGKSVTEFKKGLKDAQDTKDDVVNDVLQAGNEQKKDDPSR